MKSTSEVIAPSVSVWAPSLGDEKALTPVEISFTSSTSIPESTIVSPKSTIPKPNSYVPASESATLIVLVSVASEYPSTDLSEKVGSEVSAISRAN